mmetsp:Transcript_10061/g.11432  ORF Transcript_10061/g.11432 Transcript_10061/m.11432 type:complete len:115 (+) Transcript_10061:3-347(+)
MFEVFEKQAFAIAQAKKSFYSQLGDFYSQFAAQYEKNCLSEYASPNEEDMIFNGKSKETLSNLSDKIKNSSGNNTFELLYDMIKIETREIEGFIECIKNCDDLTLQRSITSSQA